MPHDPHAQPAEASLGHATSGGVANGANARCPRCGGGFHCGAVEPGAAGGGRPSACACASLTLDAALRADLARRYQGCLCLACLGELAAGGAGPR